MNQVLRGGCRVFVAFWWFGPKTGFSKRDGIFCSGGCWCMLLLDCRKGGGKKAYKTRFFFFWHPFLEKRKREKRREGPEVKKNTTIFTLFLGSLKNGQEVVPPFWAPKCQFFKSATKNNFFKHIQEKAGGSLFFGKGYVRKRANNKKTKR